MVFDRRPDELFQDVVRRGLTVFQNTVQGVTEIIATGDGAIRDLDGALQGPKLAPSETTEQVFKQVLTLLQESLAEARDKGNVEAPSVIQKAREVLAKINQAEPAWRPGPVAVKTPTDMFRLAMRDLRGEEALLRLAMGRGEVRDIEQLTTWVSKVNNAIQPVTESQPSEPVVRPLTPSSARRRATLRKAKAATAPVPTEAVKSTPQLAEIRFAKAVAEELGDLKVKGWAKEFADGKITEAQWQSRLTSHAAADRESLDDIYERALQRVARENNVSQG